MSLASVGAWLLDRVCQRQGIRHELSPGVIPGLYATVIVYDYRHPVRLIEYIESGMMNLGMVHWVAVYINPTNEIRKIKSTQSFR